MLRHTISTAVIGLLAGAVVAVAPASAAATASADTPFTVVDLGDLAFPTDANSSDVVVGYLDPVNVAYPTVWVNGQATQLTLPSAPTGTSFCGAQDERINNSGVIAATAIFCPSGFSDDPDTYVPTVWTPTNGVYGAPRAMEIAPSSWVRPVFDVGSCGTGFRMRFGLFCVPP